MTGPGLSAFGFSGLLVALAVVHGCTDDPSLDKVGGSGSPADARASCDETPADGSPGVLPCDVRAVLEAKCQRCHNSDDVLVACSAKGTCLRGPFPLLTWSDAHQVFSGKPVFERMRDAVAAGYMPFKTTSISPPTAPLEENEKATLLAWTRACAPQGSGSCGIEDAALPSDGAASGD